MKSKERQPCESPTHVPNCPCITCVNRNCARCPIITKDHLTPKSIAFKVLGWSHKQTNDPGNIQWLSEPCHVRKDSTTEARLKQVQLQVNGVFIKFGEHIT